MRCLTLADELRSSGAECTFAHTAKTPTTVPALLRSGHRSVELPASGDPESLCKSIEGGCDWLVVDHYGWSFVEEMRCRPWVRKIMVINDLADRPHDCDILLDQTFDRGLLAYDGLAPSGCAFLLGTQYALLRPEFAAARFTSLLRRASNQLKRVLVSVGFTDSAEVTGIILDGILESGLSLTVDVVLGPSASNLSAVRSIVEAHRDTMTLHVGSETMAELMSEADLCFGAAGTSSWERCCLGLPTVLTVVADNQREIAAHLVDVGAAMFLGVADDISSAHIVKLLHEIVRNPEVLAVLAKRSAVICDGRGARRVGMRLRPARANNGKPVWLRSATKDDLQITYAWQSQPETRRFARNSRTPSLDEHEAWFTAQLQNSGSLLSVIVCDGEDVGSVRLDRQDALSYQISIVISDSCYGQGLGLAALDLARRLVPEAWINAEILPGNSRSEALFTKAGYSPTGYGWRSIMPLTSTASS